MALTIRIISPLARCWTDSVTVAWREGRAKKQNPQQVFHDVSPSFIGQVAELWLHLIRALQAAFAPFHTRPNLLAQSSFLPLELQCLDVTMGTVLLYSLPFLSFFAGFIFDSAEVM